MMLILLLLVAILAGLGFVFAWLFVAAGALLAVWLAGWVIRPGGGRWYRW